MLHSAALVLRPGTSVCLCFTPFVHTGLARRAPKSRGLPQMAHDTAHYTAIIININMSAPSPVSVPFQSPTDRVLSGWARKKTGDFFDPGKPDSQGKHSHNGGGWDFAVERYLFESRNLAVGDHR